MINRPLSKKSQSHQKNRPNISTEAREILFLRDQAHRDYMTSRDPGDLRNMKHLRNRANKIISTENYKNKVKNFQKEGMSIKQKWQTIKEETGQSKFETPQVIIEGETQFSSPLQMAKSLNRQFIQGIRQITNNLPQAPVDPIIHYRKCLAQDQMTFSFAEIAMSQLRKIITSIKSTGSISRDNVSIKSIIMARNELEPLNKPSNKNKNLPPMSENNKNCSRKKT